MTRTHIALCLAAAAIVGAGTALAHHGWGEYDAGNPFTLAGPIVTVSPANPHVSVTVKSGDKTWLAVLAPPSRMSTRGLAPESIAAGATVSLVGYPKRNGEAEMRAERITLAGKTIELR